jgi:hypothetical protein
LAQSEHALHFPYKVLLRQEILFTAVGVAAGLGGGIGLPGLALAFEACLSNPHPQ